MVMLVIQHHCGQGYQRKMMALDNLLSVGADIVIVQESFIRNREIFIVDLTFISQKVREKR